MPVQMPTRWHGRELLRKWPESLRSGPSRMRVLPARDHGREEDRRGEATPTHPEQVIRKLREADRTLAEGAEVP